MIQSKKKKKKGNKFEKIYIKYIEMKYISSKNVYDKKKLIITKLYTN